MFLLFHGHSRRSISKELPRTVVANCDSNCKASQNNSVPDPIFLNIAGLATQD